jgi:hypothetical protein
MAQKIEFSEPVSEFQKRRLPELARPTGYAALIKAFDIDAPTPETLTACAVKHVEYVRNGWRMKSPRYLPSPDLEGQLTFALKYEGLDLCLLAKIFERCDPAELSKAITEKPAGVYTRRIWFLYEWLMKRKLPVPDAAGGNYVDVIDNEIQIGASEPARSKRHRVNDNMPGTREFCPLVFRTPKIQEFMAFNLAGLARKTVAEVPENILARAAAFLLLKDSKASYEIEGETPSSDRISQWGAAIAEAGQKPIDAAELVRLQEIVLRGARFIHRGYRREGGYIGTRDVRTQSPVPDHISARAEDLPSLINGLVDFSADYSSRIDPVVAAAVLAFGFIYIHPFEDGNGRIHRWLIHHVLALRGFNPPGVIFPVSSVFHKDIAGYKTALESYSARLLPHIKWQATSKKNVEVLNDTADFYRFFDATKTVEFLFSAVKKTIEFDMPEEVRFLARYDNVRSEVLQFVDMPERTFELLFNFLHQNRGVLSKRARENEFKELTKNEADHIQIIFADKFTNATGDLERSEEAEPDNNEPPKPGF